MTKTSFIRAGIASALMCLAAGAWAKDKPSQTFVMKAVQGNLAEASMGQLAQKQGNSEGVRSYGQQLVTDHTAANQKLTAIAGRMGMTPPSEPNKKQKSDYAKMAKMSGDGFDRAFAKHMVADHKKDIADYKKAAKMKDDQIAAYATETLPTLEKHLGMAQSLDKMSGKGGKGKMSM